MNTALILTGHMRDWKTAFPSIKKQFLDKFSPDVFIWTWDNLGYWVSPDHDPENRGTNKDSPKLDKDMIPDIMDSYHPVNLHVVHEEPFKPYFTQRAETFAPYAQEIRPANTLSMFYGIHQGVGMLEQHAALTGKHYDMVIRTRPDISWSEFDIDFDLNYQFMTAYHRNHTGQGTGDMLQISSFKGLTRFKEIAYELDALTQKHNRFCPHIFTKDYIESRLLYSLVEVNVPKVLTHTPQGQYQNYIPTTKEDE